MKKPIFIFLFPLMTLAHAEGPGCDKNEESLNPLEKKVSIDLKKIYSSAVDSVCNDDLFLSSKDPKYNGVHDEIRCEEIKLCLDHSKEKVPSEDTKKIVEELIKESALATVIEQELNFGLRYNPKTKKIEGPVKPKSCPAEKVPEDCSAMIDKVVASLGSDYFLNNRPILGTGKKQAKENCDDYAGLSKLCLKAQERVKFIAQCEKYSDGCLELEQKALGVLVNNYRRDNDLFLALENELCLPVRVIKSRVSITAVPMNKTSFPSISGMTFEKSRNSLSLSSLSLKNHFDSETSKVPEKKEETKESEGSSGPTGPDGSAINSLSGLKFDHSIKTEEQPAEEIKGLNSGDFTLSEKFSNSMNEALKNDYHASSSADASSAWNNNFSTQNYNFGTNDFKTEQGAMGPVSKSDKVGDSVPATQKKEEISALIGQINSLKEKLEEMNSRMEELKEKKETDKSQALDKEALEKEKSILELKKKLAELEADKKRLVAVEEARAKDEQTKSAGIERRTQESSAWKINSTGNNVQENNSVPRDNANASSFIQAQPSTTGRSPASVNSQAPVAGPGLVLVSSNEGASDLPPVVYMTAGELQKYPYHLSDNASSVEIEKMILNNNGAVVIVGDSEQIVPVVEKGIVQLDEAGRVKYRRVKISLVKNDKERKHKQARDISSVADLKREEQKRRDLVRYQEMKKAMEKATDH